MMQAVYAKSPNFEHFYTNHLGQPKALDSVFYFDVDLTMKVEMTIGNIILEGINADDIDITISRIGATIDIISGVARAVKELRKVSSEFDHGTQSIADSYYSEYSKVVAKLEALLKDFKARKKLRSRYLKGEGLHLNEMVESTENFLMTAF
uniref:Uncharacterized protein n=1 Tax=Rhizobium phage LG08 TaxID=3129229 RepID=A0AAU8HYH9_9CAUD